MCVLGGGSLPLCGSTVERGDAVFLKRDELASLPFAAATTVCRCVFSGCAVVGGGESTTSTAEPGLIKLSASEEDRVASMGVHAHLLK